MSTMVRALILYIINFKQDTEKTIQPIYLTRTYKKNHTT